MIQLPNFSVDIICCYNKINVLDAMLRKTMETQNRGNLKFNEVYIDCRDGKYKSATQAFNKAIAQSTSDFLFFIHQDVELHDKAYILKCVEYLAKNRNTILGACGIDSKGEVFSNIYHGVQNVNCGTPLDEYKKVVNLDEVLIAGSKEAFSQIAFDERMIDGWHFYVADFCLAATQKGYAIYLAPYKLQHKSILDMPHYMVGYNYLSKDYFKLQKVMRKKWRNTCKKISTPCSTFPTAFIPYFFYYTKMSIHYRLRFYLRYLSGIRFVKKSY